MSDQDHAERLAAITAKYRAQHRTFEFKEDGDAVEWRSFAIEPYKGDAIIFRSADPGRGPSGPLREAALDKAERWLDEHPCTLPEGATET